MTATYEDIGLDDFTSEFLMPDPVEPESEEFPTQEMRAVSSDFIEPQTETARAKRYRIKVKRGLNFLLGITAQNPHTVADAAAIVEYGPQVSKAIGNLCDKDDKARRVIDFLTEDGIDNPYVLTIAALMPLAFQVVRNHEEALEKEFKPHIRIPFTKRSIKFPFKFHLKLGFVKAYTAPPDMITEHVFTNPAVLEALAKRDIKIAWQPRNGNYNGNGRH